MHNRFDLMLFIGLVVSVLFTVTFNNWIPPNFLEYPNFPNFPDHPNIENFNNEDVANEKLITLLFGGDVMLGRMVMQTSLKNKDYSYPFEKIMDFTKDSDIFFVNLENPIIKDCPSTNTGMIFCSLPEMLEGLTKAGVNVVTLANNHSGNYGLSGLTETDKYLNDENISVTGRNNLTLLHPDSIGTTEGQGNLTFGFLGFDFTVKPPITEDYLLIADSDPKVDYLIVGVHWGEEYKNKANSYQRKWAREMVESGADIIVGSHPHYVQDYECINPRGVGTISPTRWDNKHPSGEIQLKNTNKSSIGGSAFGGDFSRRVDRGGETYCDAITGKPVYYSLGNLVFDQMWSEETKKGMLVKLEISKNGIVSEERLNTYMKNIGQPEFMDTQ